MLNYNVTCVYFVPVTINSNRKLKFGCIFSDVDIIVTFDQYEGTLIAKNACSPGFTTLVENLVNTVEVDLNDTEPKWEREYLMGCDKVTKDNKYNTC